jgi:hypothetical protein
MDELPATDRPRRGDFFTVMRRLEYEARQNGLGAVYVESIHNKFLPRVLEDYGYTIDHSAEPPSAYKFLDNRSPPERVNAPQPIREVTERDRVLQELRNRPGGIWGGMEESTRSPDGGASGGRSPAMSAMLDRLSQEGSILTPDRVQDESWEEIARRWSTPGELGDTLYHGSGAPLRQVRPGLFMSNDPETAKFFAHLDANQTGGMQRLTPFTGNFQNPLRINGAGNRIITSGQLRHQNLPALIEQAKADGHDAIVFENVLDGPGDPRSEVPPRPTNVVISLDPTAQEQHAPQYYNQHPIVQRMLGMTGRHQIFGSPAASVDPLVTPPRAGFTPQGGALMPHFMQTPNEGIFAAPADNLPRQRLLAALRDPQTGQIYTGANHGDALNSAPEEAWGRIADAYASEDPRIVGFMQDGQFPKPRSGASVAWQPRFWSSASAPEFAVRSDALPWHNRQHIGAARSVD